jgi:hypothetical protein
VAAVTVVAGWVVAKGRGEAAVAAGGRVAVGWAAAVAREVEGSEADSAAEAVAASAETAAVVVAVAEGGSVAAAVAALAETAAEAATAVVDAEGGSAAGWEAVDSEA